MPAPRLHRYLWLLTGRSDDFQNDALNTGIRYETIDELEGIREARDLLQLRRTDTDYYVLAAMSALYLSLPALRGGPTEESVIFSPGSLRIPASRCIDGELRPQDTRPITLLHPAHTLPAAHSFRVTKEGDLVRIVADNGWQTTAPSRFVGGVVYVDWPEQLPFTAAVAPPNGMWQDGSHFTLRTEPAGYPFAVVAEKIRQSGVLIQLMTKQGMLAAFVASQSPVAKVGALVAAVVNRNLKLAPSMTSPADEPDLTPGPEWTPPGGGPVAYPGGLTYYGSPLTYLLSQLTYTPAG